MEQLYPFPGEQLKTILSTYKKAAEIRWVQEESRNRGAWTFMHDRLTEMVDIPVRYIGRPSSASPASGSYNQFRLEQESIVTEALRSADKNIRASKNLSF